VGSTAVYEVEGLQFLGEWKLFAEKSQSTDRKKKS
jgi:hypothetical protein